MDLPAQAHPEILSLTHSRSFNITAFSSQFELDEVNTNHQKEMQDILSDAANKIKAFKDQLTSKQGQLNAQAQVHKLDPWQAFGSFSQRHVFADRSPFDRPALVFGYLCPWECLICFHALGLAWVPAWGGSGGQSATREVISALQ